MARVCPGRTAALVNAFPSVSAAGAAQDPASRRVARGREPFVVLDHSQRERAEHVVAERQRTTRTR